MSNYLFGSGNDDFATQNTSKVYIHSPGDSSVSTATRVTINGIAGGRSNSFDSSRSFRKDNSDINPNGPLVGEIEINARCLDCQCMSYVPHEWRKNCKDCKCGRDAHEIHPEYGARARLGYKASKSVVDPATLNYSFIPDGLQNSRQVELFYSTLPVNDVPKLKTKGDQLRSQRLIQQLPKQDLALSACKFVEDQSGYENFISGRNDYVLDIGVAKMPPPNTNCARCNKSLTHQLPSVYAIKLNAYYHPACFKCSTCRDLLVDLAYCAYENDIYCERHYSEQLKPRCAACDESDDERRIVS